MADPRIPSDDILSSIRRLVVDEQRVGAGAGAKPPVRDKLILTPNLRVVTSATRPQPNAALQPLHLQAPARVGLTTPQLVASVTQGIDPEAMDWEPESETPEPEIDSLDLARFAQSLESRLLPLPSCRCTLRQQAPRTDHTCATPQNRSDQALVAHCSLS